MRRSFIRCHSRLKNRPVVNKFKWALICLAVVALVAVSKPSRLISNEDERTGYLRSSHDVKIKASNDNQKVFHSSDVQNELLEALYDVPLPTTYEELDEVNDEFIDLDPRHIIQWAHHHMVIPKQKHGEMHPLVQVTSLGPTGLVILHLLSQLHLFKEIPIISMDTLHLFPESYEFYKTIQSYYKSEAMELVITKPLRIEYDTPGMDGEGVVAGVIERRTEFDKTYGTTLWKSDPENYTKLSKIDPLNKVLDEWQTHMWITGRRRSSGGERSDMDVLEFELLSDHNFDERKPFDTNMGRWKLNPLAYWTYDQVWNYIRSHKLPYNALYDKGYTSLGDEMTTGLPRTNASGTWDAVDAFERSGRFVGMNNKTECGLHTHLQKVKKLKEQAMESGEDLTAPKLICDKCIELNVNNFETVLTERGRKGHTLLVEFYSPYCGSCQDFAPTLNRIADHLSSHHPSIHVARFDITENEIPKVHGEELFQVEATPMLYRVRYTPSLRAQILSFYGKHDFESILRWVTKTPKEEALTKRKNQVLRKKEMGGRKRLGGGV